MLFPCKSISCTLSEAPGLWSPGCRVQDPRGGGWFLIRFLVPCFSNLTTCDRSCERSSSSLESLWAWDVSQEAELSEQRRCETSQRLWHAYGSAHHNNYSDHIFPSPASLTSLFSLRRCWLDSSAATSSKKCRPFKIATPPPGRNFFHFKLNNFN